MDFFIFGKVEMVEYSFIGLVVGFYDILDVFIEDSNVVVSKIELLDVYLENFDNEEIS